jgi:hypothetical protein
MFALSGIVGKGFVFVTVKRIMAAKHIVVCFWIGNEAGLKFACRIKA